MSKSLLEQVQENATFTARCPACTQTPGLADTPQNQMGQGPNGLHKRGRWKGLHRKSMPVCDFCKGLGVVYLNRICECGWPAVHYDGREKVWNCGSAICVAKAICRRDRPHYSANEGWHGMGG